MSHARAARGGERTAPAEGRGKGADRGLDTEFGAEAAARLDAEGRVVACSARARRLLGWPHAPGRTLDELLDPDGGWSALLARAAEGRLVRRRIHGFLRRGRERRDLVVYLAREGGGWRAVFHTSRAASPRHTGGRTYRSLFESLSVGVYVLSVDGVVLDANRRALALCGASLQHLLGLTLEDFSEGTEPLTERVCRAAEGIPQRLDWRGRLGDGPPFVAELTLCSGDYFGRRAVFGIAQDAALLESTRDELAASAGQLRALVETSPLATLALDAAGRITMWNPAARQMLAPFPGNAVCAPLHLPAVDAGGGAHPWLARVLAGATVRDDHVQAPVPGGGVLHLSLSAAPLRDRRGQTAGCVAVLADTGERVALEEEVKQMQKLDALGSLAGRVAHDFNNILTVVQGDAELLAWTMREQGQEVPEEVRDILHAAGRARALTRQLLTFGRRDAGRPELLDLDEVVRDMDGLLRRLIGADVELVTTLGAGPARVRAVRSDLDQVLINLAVNARDAMPEGGRLAISTQVAPARRSAAREQGEWLALRVADTGHGMAPDTLRRIFEPFFTTKPAGRGTGLGLWTVYGIVRGAGGKVRVRSAPGEGTEFTLLLPPARAESDADACPPGAPAPALPAARVPAEGRTALVVEDDPLLRSLMEKWLRRQGFAVVSAENGEEGLRLWRARRERVALVVSDVVMPLMSGRELAARIHADDPAVAVLLTSGYAQGEGEGPAGGGAGFLRKPFGPAELESAVAGALARGRELSFEALS